jgi:hypothetical protein
MAKSDKPNILFGKNHLGDRNEHLPTVHGFDEFLGNLYHLNAEQEPENPDYPKDPAFRRKFGPRGVLRCRATEKDDPSVWREPFSPLRAPKMFNLRADPFEAGDSSIFYDKWMMDRAFLLVPAQAIAARWLESFKEFPIRQKPASFSLDQVVAAATPHP